MEKYNFEYFIIDKNNIQLDKEGFLPSNHILNARYPKKQIKEMKMKFLKTSSNLLTNYCELGTWTPMANNEITNLYSIYAKQDWIKNKMLAFMEFTMLFNIIRDNIEKVIDTHGLDREKFTIRIEPNYYEVLLVPLEDTKAIDKVFSNIM